jgi:hypothetical protein
VSQRKRPSLADVANIASEAISSAKQESSAKEESKSASSASEDEQPSQAVYFKKFTAPLREDQLDQLTIMLASWTASKKVKFSAAEVLRLGLDKMLRLMKEEPDQAILELYQQEQQETIASETRKFGRSKGAKEYLQKAGKL